jgi:hypothetical protein
MVCKTRKNTQGNHITSCFLLSPYLILYCFLQKSDYSCDKTFNCGSSSACVTKHAQLFNYPCWFRHFNQICQVKWTQSVKVNQNHAKNNSPPLWCL